jgi:glycosidase
MPASLHDEAVTETFAAARQSSTIQVTLPESNETIGIKRPFTSPVDWRDHWIYFLMVDRFNNPTAPPKHPWDNETGLRQGGNFEGIRQQLPYLHDLGIGAIWLTPVLKNLMVPRDGSHHGYGIMDFLEIDPRFGSTPEKAEQEFIDLINEAHARGIYVILDIVINHSGDIYAYDVNGEIWNSAPWKSQPYDPIYWRDEFGQARRDWRVLPTYPPRDSGLWPEEFQSNNWLRRQGKGGPVMGDFETLKEFKTDLTDDFQDKPVWNLLIKAYQYIIAKYDIDAFRIDTLKHVEREFALTFSNAIREFAYSIGKNNFFIFGENKSDDEELLAAYTGRYTSDEAGRIGADASLDFPLQWKLGPVAKGFQPPNLLEDLYDTRKRVHSEKHLLSTHGEASRFFVTFLDNHDDHQRFLCPRDGGDYTHQLTMGLGCLFTLQGIPCLYYGTEQGLKGTDEIYSSSYESMTKKPEHVREALWGKASAFNTNHPLYEQIKTLALVRNALPALRYGRQYFRPISGNNHDFGDSKELGGIIAFSRILNDSEVIVSANTNTDNPFSGWVLIDARINTDATPYKVAYSNHNTVGHGTPVSGESTFYDRDGNASQGWARRIFVRLAPMEIQVLSRNW